ADARQLRPVARRIHFKEAQEDLLALVMDGQVDAGIGAQEALRLIGNMRAAEDDEDIRPARLQAPRDLERNLAIPDIGAEADDVAIDQLLDRGIDADALVDREAKPIAA